MNNKAPNDFVLFYTTPIRYTRCNNQEYKKSKWDRYWVYSHTLPEEATIHEWEQSVVERAVFREEDEPSPLEMLAKDNSSLREAGCDLAEAALRVIRDYDGIHRLAQAASQWMKALAEQGGRSNE